MTALEAAIQSLSKTLDHFYDKTATDKAVEIGVQTAQAWAAIAQAEQLKRIADILEKYHEETAEFISTLD